MLKYLADKIKDFTTLTAFITAVFTGMWFMFSSHLEPYLSIPNRLSVIESSLLNPELILFKGRGVILTEGDIYPGDIIYIGYTLSRRASCDTNIVINIINVDTGRTLNFGEIPAVKAPVTEDFVFFAVPLSIPENIPTGRYIYSPVIEPLNCGVYKSFNAQPSEIFTIRSNNE